MQGLILLINLKMVNVMVSQKMVNVMSLSSLLQTSVFLFWALTPQLPSQVRITVTAHHNSENVQGQDFTLSSSLARLWNVRLLTLYKAGVFCKGTHSVQGWSLMKGINGNSRDSLLLTTELRLFGH